LVLSGGKIVANWLSYGVAEGTEIGAVVVRLILGTLRVRKTAGVLT